jgi:hypothetical protein
MNSACCIHFSFNDEDQIRKDYNYSAGAKDCTYIYRLSLLRVGRVLYNSGFKTTLYSSN